MYVTNTTRWGGMYRLTWKENPEIKHFFQFIFDTIGGPFAITHQHYNVASDEKKKRNKTA